MTNSCRISSERIARAITVIDPVFLNSPQVLDESPGKRLACRLVVKLEAKDPLPGFFCETLFHISSGESS